jgi:hypothetical protein
MPGVQEAWKKRLQMAGMEKVQDLMRWKVEDLVALGIPLPDAEELIRQSKMITLKGMGIENYRLLQEAQVRDLLGLAQQNPHDIYLRLRARISLQPTSCRTPTPALVRLWVREARKKEETTKGPRSAPKGHSSLPSETLIAGWKNE